MVNITELDIAHAGKNHTSGWPAHGVMSSMGRPDEILTDPALRPGNICNPPTGHGWGLGGKIGPIV